MTSSKPKLIQNDAKQASIYIALVFHVFNPTSELFAPFSYFHMLQFAPRGNGRVAVVCTHALE